MTSEELVIATLRRPDIHKMKELVDAEFGKNCIYHVKLDSFLRRHLWFLDEYMKERNR